MAKQQNNEAQLKLIDAIETGCLQGVKDAVSAGADVNLDKWPEELPFHLAIINGHLEIAKYLLEQGADFNAFSVGRDKAIHLSARNGNVEVFKFLIAKGVDVNENSGDDNGGVYHNKVSHLAAECGNLELIKFLVEDLKIDMDKEVNLLKHTPMHKAALADHTNIVSYLSEKGFKGETNPLRVVFWEERDKVIGSVMASIQPDYDLQDLLKVSAPDDEKNIDELLGSTPNDTFDL